MRTYGRLIVLVVGVGLVAPVLAESESAGPARPAATGDELEQNRQKLAQYRADPKRYAQLLADHQAFKQLPAERQERMRKLDQDLHKENKETRDRLLAAADRYVTWLDRLALSDPNDQQRITEALNARQRLRVVKEVREQRLPLALREYVRDSLRPVLSAEERKWLDSAEGRWPEYPRRVITLADKHPVALPGPTTGPKNYKLLPEDVKKALPAKELGKHRQKLSDAVGKWPEYAIVFTEVARERKVELPRQLGPSRPEEFSAVVQQFLREKLLPKLTDGEKAELEKARGSWPEYPRVLLRLATQYGLPVPGMAPPGPPEFWAGMRSTPPEKLDPKGRPMPRIGPDEGD